MKKMTMKVPVGNNQNKEVYREDEVTGEVIGPFLVHVASDVIRGRAYTVTHIKTGFAAQRLIPTKPRARWLARKLSELPVWDFDTPAACKKFSQELLVQISVLRADAMCGDMQGTSS